MTQSIWNHLSTGYFDNISKSDSKKFNTDERVFFVNDYACSCAIINLGRIKYVQIIAAGKISQLFFSGI